MEESKYSAGLSKRSVPPENDYPESKRRKFFESSFPEAALRKFPTIRDILTKMNVGTKLEFLGIVIKMEEITLKTTRTGNMLPMRKVLLTDNGNDEIFLTIWGPESSRAPIAIDTVVYAKVATLITFKFGMEKLLSSMISEIVVDPSMPEADRLRNLPKKTAPDALPAPDAVPAPDALLAPDALCTQPPVNTTSKNVFFKSRFAFYKFVSVADIHTKYEMNAKLDFIGLVVDVGKQGPWMSRNGERMVRDVTLMDHTGAEIVARIYSSEFDTSEILPNFVLYLKTASIASWLGTKRLRVIRFNVWVNPEESEVPEVCELKKLIKTMSADVSGNVRQKTEVSKPQGNCEMMEIERPTSDPCKSLCYTQIGAISDTVSAGKSVNVLGVVIHRKQLETKVVNYKHFDTLEVVILDQSERQISMAICGPQAKTLASIETEHLIVEGAKVSIMTCEGIKRLICSNLSAKLKIEPKIEEAKQLRKWFETVWLNKNRENGSTSPTEALVDGDEREDLPDSLRTATFTPIFSIHETILVDSIINIVAVVHELGPLHTIEYPNGSTSSNRVVTVVDDSQKSISLKILDARANTIERGASIAVTNVKLCPQKMLVPSINDSVLFVNPSLEKARALRKWYKINAIDKPFVEIMLPITPNSRVFKKFADGDETSLLGILKEKHELNFDKKPDTPVTTEVWRRIELVDHTAVTIGVILWGDEARNFDVAVGSILLITNVRVSIIQQSRFCCFAKLSKIIVQPTDPNVVDYVNRLQIWSNVRMLRNLSDRPVEPAFCDVEIIYAVLNATISHNSMDIFMIGAKGSYHQERKNDPDSETYSCLDDERNADATSQPKEENKTSKVESEECLDSESHTILDAERNADVTSQPKEENKRSKVESEECLDSESHTILDAERNADVTSQPKEENKRSKVESAECLDSETYTIPDAERNADVTSQPNEEDKRSEVESEECLDSETHTIPDAERNAELTSQPNEENKRSKDESEKCLDSETHTIPDAERNADVTSQPNEENKRSKDESEKCLDSETHTIPDAERNADEISQPNEEIRRIKVEPEESVHSETFTDCDAKRNADETLPPNEENVRIKVEIEECLEYVICTDFDVERNADETSQPNEKNKRITVESEKCPDSETRTALDNERNADEISGPNEGKSKIKV